VGVGSLYNIPQAGSAEALSQSRDPPEGMQAAHTHFVEILLKRAELPVSFNCKQQGGHTTSAFI
jgi:hypothetical protein